MADDVKVEEGDVCCKGQFSMPEKSDPEFVLLAFGAKPA